MGLTFLQSIYVDEGGKIEPPPPLPLACMHNMGEQPRFSEFRVVAIVLPACVPRRPGFGGHVAMCGKNLDQ